MPQPRKSSRIYIVVAAAFLIPGITAFISLAVGGLLLSFWLILPIVLVVLGLVATGLALFDYFQREKTISDDKPIIPLETANREAHEDPEKAKSKLMNILEKNGLDFQKAEAGIKIMPEYHMGVGQPFYLIYGRFGELFTDLQPTEDQKQEFEKGRQMLLQLLPSFKENTAIQIREVMALDENIKLSTESSTKSGPVLSQPTDLTNVKPPFPGNYKLPPVQSLSNSDPLHPMGDQGVQFKRCISQVFKPEQLSFSSEENFLTWPVINPCSNPTPGQKMLYSGNYYEFYRVIIDPPNKHAWTTFLGWVKEEIDKSFGWPRSGPNEALHISSSDSEVKLVVRWDAVEKLLEGKKEVSSVGLTKSSGDM